MNTPSSNPDTASSFGKSMLIATWVLLLTGFTWFFDRWLSHENNPNQQLMTSTDANGVAETILQRNRYGHYVASGEINGEKVEFLLDTGATYVSVPEDLAKRLNLKFGAPQYVDTANGSIEVYATRLAQVNLGRIELQDVRASINPHTEGDEVLLGMSFLKHLEWIQRGDTLTLRYSPHQVPSSE